MNNLEIIQMYSDGKSLQQIATHFQTYPNKIKRILEKAGFARRTRSEAQILSYEDRPHPREGVPKSEEEKRAIGQSLAKTWKELPEKEKKRRAKISKRRYNDMTVEEKQAFAASGHTGLRQSAKEGSKLERFVCDALTEAGYVIERHKHEITMDRDLEVDIFLPNNAIVIEIDGPTHSLPIFGEEKLQKTMAADMAKNGILINSGYVVIRAKCTRKNVSNTICRNISTKIVELVKETIEKFPPKNKRLIEIGVDDV